MDEACDSDRVEYVMGCTIWYHLYNFKNVKNTQGGVLILVKLQASTYHTYQHEKQNVNGPQMTQEP